MRKNHLRFLWTWTLSNAAGIIGGYLVSLIVVLLVHSAFGFNLSEWGTPLSQTVMQIAGGSFLGLCVGWIQKSLLKKQYNVSNSWIYAMVAAFAMAELLAGIVFWQLGLNRAEYRFIEFKPLPEVAIFAFTGLIAGIFQAQILHKTHTGAFFRIVSGTVGWGVCIFGVYLAGLFWSESVSLLGFPAGALVYGIITGPPLIWLTQPKETNLRTGKH